MEDNPGEPKSVKKVTDDDVLEIAPSGGKVKGQSRIAAEVESQSVSAARARSQPKLADVSGNSNLFSQGLDDIFDEILQE